MPVYRHHLQNRRLWVQVLVPLPEKHRVFVKKTRCFSSFYELLQEEYCVLTCFAKGKYAVFPYVFPYGILNRLHAFVECLCPRRTFSGHGLGNMTVNIHGKGGSGMAQVCLYVLDIIAGLQRVDSKTVS